MTEESVTLSSDQNIEYCIVTLFEKLENLRNDSNSNSLIKLPIRAEIRTLEFWRAVISECLISLIYVFLVCGASSDVTAPLSTRIITTSLAAGLAAASLTHCFGHISGAHINPAITLAMTITKKISVMRAFMYVLAQCGGAIAGAAFLYGVTSPFYQGNLSTTLTHSANEAPWEKLGIEFILTFIVVFSYLISMNGPQKWMGTSALMIGTTYSACSFVLMPYLNPARSLGPSFIMNKWSNYWVYWLGPLMGGAISGLLYEYVFNPKRHNKSQKNSNDNDSSSIHFDEDTYDDLDKPATQKFHGSTYNTYRPAVTTNGPSGYCASLVSTSLYSAPTTKLECIEPLYEGTKSLYCKSPPLTRANLNRSQSVYTKSNSGVNKEFLPKPGPLVPTQSLYPMRITQQSQAQNQNLQNQLQQRSESIYGVRGITPGTATRNDDRNIIYGNRNNEENQKNSSRGNRPESMYGMVSSQTRRGQSSTQSDDSSYGSYPSSAKTNTNTNSTYPANNTSNFQTNKNVYGNRNTGNDIRQPPQLLTNTSNTTYHHSLPQHSPNLQYQ